MNTSNPENFMEPSIDGDGTENGKSFYEKVKGVASKGYEMAGKVLDMNSHADWVEGKWEKFKSVSSEWMKDVAETVRMKTTDKWRFMSEQKNTNKLIAHKEEDIKNLDYVRENEERNIQSFEGGRSSDLEKFNSALDSIKDPHIREIFERNRDEKVDEWELKIDESRDAISSVEDKKIQYLSEIVDFRKDIKEAGEDFSDKIDSRIDNIREKCGYEDKKDQLESLNEQIDDGYDNLKATKDKIAEYKNALDIAEKIGVSHADLRTLEDGIDDLESEREHFEHQIEQAEIAAESLKKGIAKIDKKTAKWEKMRKKLGLVKDKAPNSDSEQEEREFDDEDRDLEAENDDDEFGDDPIDDRDRVDQEVDQGGQEPDRDSTDHDSRTGAGEEDLQEDDSRLKGENDTAATPAQESTDNSEDEEQIDGGNEADSEDAEAKANKEAIAEWLGKAFEKLYKNVNSKEKTAVEILDEALEVGKAVEYYRYAFAEEEYAALSKGVLQIKNIYDHAEIEIAGDAIAEQIKKDVFNKVLRKLPDWINI